MAVPLLEAVLAVVLLVPLVAAVPLLVAGELSVGVRKSKTVALRHPVMPVSNGFRGRVVGINSRKL